MLRATALASIILGLGACGATDPLVGTWQYSAPRTTLTWTFTADKHWSSNTTGTDPTTDCAEATRQSGTWSTSGDQLTITASSGTIEISGCTDASHDQAEAPDPDLDTTPRSSTYVLDGDSLIDTPMGASNSVTLKRQ
jgi:hypothetical protein